MSRISPRRSRRGPGAGCCAGARRALGVEADFALLDDAILFAEDVFDLVPSIVISCTGVPGLLVHHRRQGGRLAQPFGRSAGSGPVSAGEFLTTAAGRAVAGSGFSRHEEEGGLDRAPLAMHVGAKRPIRARLSRIQSHSRAGNAGMVVVDLGSRSSGRFPAAERRPVHRRQRDVMRSMGACRKPVQIRSAALDASVSNSRMSVA